MEERRRFSRIRFSAVARLSSLGTTWEGRLEDVSLKGALLRLPGQGDPQPGSPCVVEIELGADDAIIHMEGKVVRVDGDLLGVDCERLDLDSATHLRRLVELNLGEEALLQREFQALVDSAKPH